MMNSDCLHPHTKLEHLPPGQEHFAVLKCAACDAWMRFIPHPCSVSRRQRNAININKISQISALTDWEKGFCEGIRQNPRPTPRQQALLDQLVAKYLEGVDTNEQNRNISAIRREETGDAARN
jgi:hypothetical protein